MRDFTKDSIAGHIVALAVPFTVGALAQVAYHVVDLYFVSKIGAAATAGITAAGNFLAIVVALTQVVGAGTAVLIGSAFGRKDQLDASAIFNQALLLSVVSGVVLIAVMCACVGPFMRSVAADAATVEAGSTFLLWVLPAHALVLPMTVLGAGLRGVGIVRPTVAISILTVIINVALAPVLISGWGTGVAFGVEGAALATGAAIAIGACVFAVIFPRVQSYLSIEWGLMKINLRYWTRILAIGLPLGGEIVIGFLKGAMVYYFIRNFGASAQAGLGIGMRVAHTMLLPAVAVGFAVSSIVSQCFGASDSERVRMTFVRGVQIATAVMIVATILAHWQPMALLRVFDTDSEVLAVAGQYMRIAAYSFVATAVAATCSGMFQGLNNTVPSLIMAGVQLSSFAVPILWLSVRAEFRIEQVWYAMLASTVLQAAAGVWMLHSELGKKWHRQPHTCRAG